ncbi:hypothetical protein T484DRAFT_1801386 [Baffinella frigidus]|nr:hypothetical protein T484DRAFT_1801386 [Cryptophyta sp. CCMP2293]
MRSMCGADAGAGGECLDIDECRLDKNMCPHLAYCMNTQGGFTCVCPAGTQAAFVLDFDGCIKLIYTSFLISGNASVTPASLHLSVTATYDLLGVLSVASAPMHKVALFAFFLSKAEALAAELTLLDNKDAFLTALADTCSSVVDAEITHDPVYAINPETTEDPFLFPATGVENFPCGNEMYDPNNPTQRTTSCCLPTFEEFYRPIASFAVNEFLGTPCNATLPKLAPPSNFLPETDHLAPGFPDMPLSRVSVWLDEPYVRIWKGQARLDDHELRQHAAMLGETAPPFAAHTITTFLGLAHFSPTGTTTFLDSAASQTTITLTKNNWMTVATLSGINEYSFFEYCNMRLHQVGKEYEEEGKNVA